MRIRGINRHLVLSLVALKKMGPNSLAEKPMMFLVGLSAITATGILLREIYDGDGNVVLHAQMIFWLWMTVFFSCLVDSYVEILLVKEKEDKKPKILPKLIKKIKDLGDPTNYEIVPNNSIKSGNYILLQSGDEVPFDGEIIVGQCYVYDSDITGEIGDILKSAKGDSKLIAGSDLLGKDDWVIMKVTFAKNKSFFAKYINQLEGIKRASMPSEMALDRLIWGISILFVSVIFAIVGIADYSGVKIESIYIIDLIVILLPTTISALQNAVILFTKAKLAEREIIVEDDVTMDNAVDLQLALIDKTGTITKGMREMIAFELVDPVFEKDYLFYLLLSSVIDDTYEGKSIAKYARKKMQNIPNIEENRYKFYPFSASEPISGCDYQDFEVRKGNILEITKYLGLNAVPKEIKSIVTKIAARSGTPLILTVNQRIVGVIHLRDRIKKDTIRQINTLRESGIEIILITGDNELTTQNIAKKIHADGFYSNCTPEKKLAIVKELQKKGYVVAMCGDGLNDALAMAQADIGVTFSKEGKVHSMLEGNIISKKHDLTVLTDLRNICRKMTAKRGALTVFSLGSDIAKYFVIVPTLFTTAFPSLETLNFMNFKSLESIILASVMFNALVIIGLSPFVFSDNRWARGKSSLWKNMILFSVGGVFSPFLFIKLFETITIHLGVV